MGNSRKISEIINYYGKGVTPKYVDKSSVIVLNQKCVRNNKIDYKFAQYIDDSKQYNEAKFLKVGDILVNSTGQGTAGRVAFVASLPDEKRVIVDSHILVLRVDNLFEAQCLNYNLFFIEKTLQSFMDGSTGQGEFDKIRLFNINVNYPKDSFTQQKISSVLSALDDKIELNNEINIELEAMAKMLYDYWFVQFDFPNAEGKPYKSSGGEMVFDEVLKREIPKGWETGNLSDLGDVIGGSTPPREKEEYFTKSGTAWITPRDLSNNKGNKFIFKGELDVSEMGIKNASLRVMPKGTVLLSTRAPVGYLAISQDKVTTNQGFKSFVPNKGFSTEFIYYAVKNLIPTIENNAVGSTFKEISASTLKSIPICLPERTVLDAYNKIISPFFDRQKILELQNQELASLRDWLLPMLMNGQVKVFEGYWKVEEKLSIVAEEEIKYNSIK